MFAKRVCEQLPEQRADHERRFPPPERPPVNTAMALFGKGEGGSPDTVADAGKVHRAVIGAGRNGDIEARLERMMFAIGLEEAALPVAAVTAACEADGVKGEG